MTSPAVTATDPAIPATPSDAPPATIDTSALADVKQLTLGAALVSLGYVFWVVGGMEMVERLAYYGVKAVATLYAKDPVSHGGLGVTLSRFGTILMCWALIQCTVPVLTGGLSDRYGYKETIFASTLVKISGYLTMAFFPTYYGFFAGAALLATGTAIFKPGIQGTLAKVTNRGNSSIAWGIFYQTVNIGGTFAPLVAGFMRTHLAWRSVFFTCAGIICANFLLLLTYKEPHKEERLERARLRRDAKLKERVPAVKGYRDAAKSPAAPLISDDSLVVESLRELRKPHVWSYVVIFSGFWFCFNSLFDVLPAHIEDWVNTGDIIGSLFGAHGPSSQVVRFFIVMNPGGTEIMPEGMLNLDALLIMFTCFLFAHLSGKMRATTSMVVGTLIAAAAMAACGFSMAGWISAGAICVFAVGEMLSSPKFSEFMGNIAPADKKAMYLGFSQISLAIGWTLEGKLGPMLYDHYASKDRFAREMLVDRGMPHGAVDAIPQGEAFTRLVAFTHLDRWDLTAQLYHAHNVGMVWYIMAGVGVLSAGAIAWYGNWILGLNHVPNESAG